MTNGPRIRTVLAVGIVCALVGGIECASGSAVGAGATEWITRTADGLVVQTTEADASIADNLLARTVNARRADAEFLGLTFPRTVTLVFYPDRPTFEAFWRDSVPGFQPQCWMIGRTIGSRIDILSPRTWPTQSCGHAGNDFEVDQVIAHELVHALHAQVNAQPDVNIAADTKWFNEGVAVFVSGQLDVASRARVADSVRAGYTPARLAAVLQHADGYALAGSMVAYVDATRGRATTRRMLSLTTTAAMTAEIGLATESEFVAAWRQWVLSTGLKSP
jgi:hypothetical protein